MAIFYTDSGSFNLLQVTGSANISASSGIALQLKSSGSTIFSISGSGGEIFNISDSSSSNLFSVSSGSLNIFSIDNTKTVRISGSLIITGSITGTASYASTALSSSYALTASYALNGGSGINYAIVTGSITASVDVGNELFLIKSGSYTPFSVGKTGTTTISGSASNLLLVKNTSGVNLLTVSQSGVILLSTSSIELSSPAPNGGIYFTSSSLFIGVD